MTTREEATDRFIAALEKTIEDHWGEMAPWACDDDLELEPGEEYPNPYVAAWAISLGIASLDRPKSGSFVCSYAPGGQLFFTTSGLLRSAAEHWDV